MRGRELKRCSPGSRTRHWKPRVSGRALRPTGIPMSSAVCSCTPRTREAPRAPWWRSTGTLAGSPSSQMWAVGDHGTIIPSAIGRRADHRGAPCSRWAAPCTNRSSTTRRVICSRARLRDYGMPNIHSAPPITLVHLEGSKSTGNPIGAKGVGEGGCIATTTTLMGAVEDALRPLGRRIGHQQSTDAVAGARDDGRRTRRRAGPAPSPSRPRKLSKPFRTCPVTDVPATRVAPDDPRRGGVGEVLTLLGPARSRDRPLRSRSATPRADVEPMPHRIEYVEHAGTIRVSEERFGLGADYWRGGLGWAMEHVSLTTHSGTHVDAPYHYAPFSGGRPARHDRSGTPQLVHGRRCPARYDRSRPGRGHTGSPTSTPS
jgi:hypothetical protein